MNTHLISRILGTGVLTVAAMAFAGSACEKPQTRPEPSQTGSQTSGNSAQQATQQAQTAEPPKVTVPTDVGPKAPALFAISGLKGYTEPCGCTLDIMLGGIDRIVRYLDEARALYPASGLVDAGDLLFEHAEYEEAQKPQERARVDVITAALQRLKPQFTVPGERDFALGATFYLDALKKAGIEPRAVNLSISGNPLNGAQDLVLDGQRLQLIPVVDPELYKDIPDLKADAPEAGLQAALAQPGPYDARILVAHGGLAFVKAQLTAHPALNFGIVGHNPRETDQSDPAGQGHTLEPYDQGRYIGVLKLYPHAGDSSFANAQQGSKAEVENIEKQIGHVNDSINRLPVAANGEESPMLANLKKRLADLEQRRETLKTGAIHVPEDESAFLWRTIPMEPTLAVDPGMEDVRKAYNKSLKTLSLSVERTIQKPAQGQATYIGTPECATCHAPAHEFWKTMAHAKAWETLEQRDKEFDQTCIGCHVVGYEKPGGSVVGQVQYEDTIQGPNGAEIRFQKDLRDVGCESCHGPGSLHRFAPVGADGQPQHILKGSGVDTCMQCHVPEHSPRFNYDTYIQRITGEGHKLSAP